MKLRVAYFAWLREHAGADAEDLETDAGTPGELWAELEARHEFHADRASLRVAVNDEFAAWDEALSEGDQVVFIPPVAGG
jgi:molybdopterin converting factor subunit 1